MLLFDSKPPTTKVLKAYEGMQKRLPHGIPYQEIREAKETLYSFVGAKEEDLFFFTGGERENAATVFYGVYFDRIVETGKNFLMAPRTERASILQTMERLESVGCETIFLPVDNDGKVTVATLEKHFSPKISLLALSWVNPLTGVIQPIPEIAEWCKGKGILLYVDASEIFAKHFFRFQDLPIDYLSFSGDKFHAPLGTGGLFMKKEAKVRVTLFPEENENIPALIALAAAANEMMDLMDSSLLEVARLRAFFEMEMKRAFPDIIFFGEKTHRLPTISAFAIPHMHGEALLFALEAKGIRASRGGGEQQLLLHVLESMGVSSALAHAAITINFSMMTDDMEVQKLLKAFEEVLS